MDARIQVTLAANAGVLLRYGDTAILLDVLFSYEENAFCAPSPAVREKILRGDPPFEKADYLLFTHLHSDHFSGELTGEYLRRHPVKGLLLPLAEEEPRPEYLNALGESGTACFFLTGRTARADFRLSPDLEVTAFRTLHLDEKYHAVPHFCYLIRCGEKRLFFTSDADYRLETFSFLGDAPLRAVFVNPLFFSDLQRRRFFRGSLPTETVVVYHLPFPPEDEKTLGRMFSRSLRECPENGPGVRVLERELETIEL